MRPWLLVRHPAGRGIGLGLACALVAWAVGQLSMCRALEDWALDSCFFWRGKRPTDARLVLIGLDNDSLNDLRKPAAFLSPELAEVVRYAHAQSAAAIGIDVMVPDSLGDLDDIAHVGGAGDALPMGKAVAQAGPVVLPQWGHGESALRPLRQWQFVREHFHPGQTDFGFVDLNEDDDQFIRRQQLAAPDDAEVADPQFALALFAQARGKSIRWDGQHQLVVGDTVVPVDADGAVLVNYIGPPGTLPVHSFRDVLAAARSGQPLPEIRGATVLIGITARSQQDYHSTPYANHYVGWPSGASAHLMSGMEVQANTLATLHDRAFIRSPWWLTPLLWLLVLGGLLGTGVARLTLQSGLALTVGHHLAWKGVALGLFWLGHYRVEVVPMLLMGALVYVSTFIWRWRTLRRMFGLVKSQAVVLALEADPRRLELGGDRREITVLFADVRSFTPFSERHQAEEVVRLLNAYYGAVVPILEAHGGTLITYMGDGILVQFGAPVSCDDHATRAVRAAVAMLRCIEKRRRRWARLDQHGIWTKQGGLRVRIGIHTGDAVLGAIGSPHRLDYTAIGDTVNVASRLEAANKKAETELLLSEATYERLSSVDRKAFGLSDTPLTICLDGREKPIHAYTLERCPAPPQRGRMKR